MRRSRGETRQKHGSGVDALLSADPTARRPVIKVVAGVVLAFVAIAVLFVGGDLLGRYVIYRAERAKAGVTTPVTAAGVVRDLGVNAFMASAAPDVPELLTLGLPVYDLRLAANELRALQRTADQVVARDVSLGVERTDHDAQLCVDGSWVPVRIKLRGLMAYHYNKNHFSFRLKLPSNGYIDGMRELNLLELYDKGLFVDPVSQATLAAKGLMTVRSRYAVVRLNGKVLGLYQEWEHFSRSLADRLGRPEGTIFGGDGQLFGKEGTAYDKAKAAMAQVQACLPKDGAAVAAQCGWPLVSTLFDVDRLAWSAAMSQLLHATHTWNPDNLRLFWDPAWGRFEPIPWDDSLVRLDVAHSPDGETDRRALSDLLLASGELRRARDARLWQLITTDVEHMVARAEADFAAIEPALKIDRRHLDMVADRDRVTAYRTTLRANAADLRRLLERADVSATAASGAGVGGASVRIVVANHARASVVIRAVTLADGGEVALPTTPTAIVDGSWQGAPGTIDLEVALPDGARATGIRADNWVTNAALTAMQMRWTAIDTPFPAPLPAPATATLPASIAAIAGVRVEGNTVHFGPGRVVLDNSVTVPPGLAIVIEAGTSLLLGPDVALISHGDLTALGTVDKPITIAARDPAHTFGAVAILGDRSALPQVRLQHLHMVGGKGASGDRTHFTSAFAIHGAQIWLRDCTFKDAKSDDGVNFKNARIDIARLRIERSRDDSFDCDFCTGRVADSVIVASGADGFDFSGSDVTLSGDRVEGCADKGFSIGEHTIAVIRDANVQHCTTGAASKDRSELNVQSGIFSDLRVGFAQYVKKATFGPAALVVSPAVVLQRVQTPRLREILGGDGLPMLCPDPVR